MNNKSIEDNCIAVFKSYIPYHVLKMPVVNVTIEKCSTAPKLEKTSIITRDKPAITAGLIKGIDNLWKTWNLLKPKVLPASIKDIDWLKKAVRDIIYTYGYNVKEKTIIAP